MLRSKFFGYLIIGIIIYSSCISSQEARQLNISKLTNDRIEYINSFLEAEHSPLDSADLQLLDFYDYNESYRVIAKFGTYKNTETINIQTYSGKQKEFYIYGIANFELNDIKYALKIYRNIKLMKMDKYKDHLFIPFKDHSNGISTYGGGRYIDISIDHIVKDSFVLDFNNCYNPYCAYSDGYNCPIPPIDNHLIIEIKAGEKKYKGIKK